MSSKRVINAKSPKAAPTRSASSPRMSSRRPVHNGSTDSVAHEQQAGAQASTDGATEFSRNVQLDPLLRSIIAGQRSQSSVRGNENDDNETRTASYSRTSQVSDPSAFWDMEFAAPEQRDVAEHVMQYYARNPEACARFMALLQLRMEESLELQFSRSLAVQNAEEMVRVITPSLTHSRSVSRASGAQQNAENMFFSQPDAGTPSVAQTHSAAHSPDTHHSGAHGLSVHGLGGHGLGAHGHSLSGSQSGSGHALGELPLDADGLAAGAASLSHASAMLRHSSAATKVAISRPKRRDHRQGAQDILAAFRQDDARPLAVNRQFTCSDSSAFDDCSTDNQSEATNSTFQSQRHRRRAHVARN